MTRSNRGFGAFLLVFAVLVAGAFAGAPQAQEPQSDAAAADSRAATGGAQTREDIMARQAGQSVTPPALPEIGGAGAPTTAPLGTLGGASDADIYRALRHSDANLTVTARGPADDVVIQDTGMAWLSFRKGPLAQWGGISLVATIGLLVLFYLLRGRIRIDGEPTGQTIERFAAVERFAHWLLAVSFLILGVTGLVVFFGRHGLIPLMGHESYAVLAASSKWIHNNVSWAFMLSIVLVFVLWVWHNLPNATDLRWMAQGGGLFVKGVHPPAKKFNAGQKLIFWSVVLLGGSISLSGLSLLFPFELPMFAKTFAVLNATGLPQLFGFGVLPTDLLPHQEMQLAAAWHTIVAFAMLVIIIAHIYIGSVGMEGAFDAMGSGHVEKQWAREHHSLWYEEVTGEPADHGHVSATGHKPHGAPAE